MGYQDDQAERERSHKMSEAIRQAAGFGDGPAEQDTEGVQVRDRTGRFAGGFDQGARGGHAVQHDQGNDAINRALRARVGIVPDDAVPAGATVEV